MISLIKALLRSFNNLSVAHKIFILLGLNINLSKRLDRPFTSSRSVDLFDFSLVAMDPLPRRNLSKYVEITIDESLLWLSHISNDFKKRRKLCFHMEGC